MSTEDDEINEKDACDEEEMHTNEQHENADTVEHMEEIRENSIRNVSENHGNVDSNDPGTWKHF